jgi:hypothetical protein
MPGRRSLLLALLALPLACREKGHESRSEPSAGTSGTAMAPAPLELAVPPSPAPSNSSQKRPTTLLYVRIPAAIDPLVRGEKFEEPLDALLRERDLGEVSGGGTALKSGGGIEYVGIDVDVYDAKVALPAVIAKLRELKAPQGTTVEETSEDEPAVSHPVW